MFDEISIAYQDEVAGKTFDWFGEDNAENFSKDILKKHELNNLDNYALQGGSFSTAKFPTYE